MLDSGIVMDKLLVAGLPVTGVTVAQAIVSAAAGITTWFPVGDGTVVGITWGQQPTQQQSTQASAVVVASLTPTADDALALITIPVKVLAALLARSTPVLLEPAWVTNTIAAAKTKLQQLLNGRTPS